MFEPNQLETWSSSSSSSPCTSASAVSSRKYNKQPTTSAKDWCAKLTRFGSQKGNCQEENWPQKIWFRVASQEVLLNGGFLQLFEKYDFFNFHIIPKKGSCFKKMLKGTIQSVFKIFTSSQTAKLTMVLGAPGSHRRPRSTAPRAPARCWPTHRGAGAF